MIFRMTARRRSKFLQPWLIALVSTLLVLGNATPAFAQEEEEMPNARTTGYETKVELGGGVALSYMLMAFLGVISVGLTFKNARRTHLD